MVVVVTTGAVASRRNVVATLRGLPDPPVVRRRTVVLAGAVAMPAGVAIAVAGLVAGDPAATVAGPALAAAGVAATFDAPARRRRLVSGAAGAACIWSIAAVAVVPATFSRLGVGLVASEGIVLTAGAIAVSTVFRSTRGGTDAGGSHGGRRRTLPVTIGLAYARRDRAGAVLVSATYALVIFTLTLLATLTQLYRGDTDTVATRLGGGAALEVTSNPAGPVPAADVTRLDGVTRVTPAAEIPAQLESGATSTPLGVAVVGFGADFAGHGAPRLETGSGASAAATFAAVARDPGRVIVGRDLLADPRSGLGGHDVRVGATLRLRDAASGRTTTVRIAAIAGAARYDGVDHVYVARSLVDQLAGGPAATNLLFVDTSPGTHNEVLAAIIDGTHLANGTYARSFVTLAQESLSARQRFLNLVTAYAAIGLLAMVAGIAVVMLDRIRQRRRELAVMRALGFGARTIRRAVRVETAALATRGTVIGAAAGIVLGWCIVANGRATQHLPFRAPLVPVAAMLVIVVVVSLASAGLAARRAGRNRPAAGLRTGD